MKIGGLTPELPVADVEAAQRYYRDHLGFKIGWHHREGRIGAVSHGECVVFFRESDAAVHPSTFWVFVEHVDNTYLELKDRGAEIADPIEDKPWGLRQFTVKDLNGNMFHFFHDLGS